MTDHVDDCWNGQNAAFLRIKQWIVGMPVGYSSDRRVFFQVLGDSGGGSIVDRDHAVFLVFGLLDFSFIASVCFGEAYEFRNPDPVDKAALTESGSPKALYVK